MEKLPPVPDLRVHLRELLAQVPPGRVTTCMDLAQALGSRQAARWVGHFLLHHEHDRQCTCHRVVRAGGELGGYIGRQEEKIERLAAEGIVLEQGRVPLERFGYRDFQTRRPLLRLRRLQRRLAKRVVLCPPENLPHTIAGVDVAYPSEYEAVASYALVDAQTAQLRWSVTVRQKIVFPYITSFLGFRELPVLVAAIEQARRAGQLAEVLLVDGSGVLHQRHAGIASHLGVLTGLTTVGVTKKLLCGNVDLAGMDLGTAREVVHEGQVVGVALRTSPRSKHPVFISPGHKCDLHFCQTVVPMVLRGRRLPEPLYWADRLCRQAAK